MSDKSICKIITPYKTSLGFLIKFIKKEKDFFCLITSKDNINKDIIQKKEKIKFYYDKKNKSKENYLNSNERLIKEFEDININVIVIEIIPEDKINKNYFLLNYIYYLNDFDKLINKEITLIQYNKRKINYYNEKIIKINDY